MSKKPIHRIAILISITSFFGSTAFAVVGAVNSMGNQPTPITATATSSVQLPQLQESQLKLQERAYEVVLKQEPENETALAGLVEARLQMNNVKGAVKPLEKLVKLYPSQKEYKALLTQVKQQVGGANTSNSN